MIAMSANCYQFQRITDQLARIADQLLAIYESDDHARSMSSVELNMCLCRAEHAPIPMPIRTKKSILTCQDDRLLQN